MTTQVGVLEARNSLSELIKRVKAGEDVVITSRNVAQVRLVPVAPPAKHGTGQAILDWLGAHTATMPVLRTEQQIEADIAAERGAWE